MNQHLILTVISNDKPGIVQLLATTIKNHQGNWLESRMTHLAGKFAGILQVDVADEHLNALLDALKGLHDQGLHIVAETTEGASLPHHKAFSFSVIGPDRPGIVAEISHAFTEHSISVNTIETHCSSMPWSGEPLFEATGNIHIPETVDMDALYDQLDIIADKLAVDIRVEALSSAELSSAEP